MAETTRQSLPASGRIAGFDGLRGVAAALVVTLHLGIGTDAAWVAFSTLGQSALHLFCAMSGFLLARSIDLSGKPSPRLSAVASRFRRLLPLHLLWTTFYLAALPLLDRLAGTSAVPGGFWSPASLARAYLRGSAEIHLWFLPALLGATAVFAAIDALPVRPLRRGWLWLAAGTALAFAHLFCRAGIAGRDVLLLGFLAVGAGLRRIFGAIPGAPLRRIRFAAAAMLPFLLAAVPLLSDARPRAVADFLLVASALAVFSSFRFPATRAGGFFAATSLGVYLVHPFLGRLFAIPARRLGLAPLPFPRAALFALLVYAVSLAAACAPLLWKPRKKAVSA